MEARDIILEYWKSWQGHNDWDKTRKLMADDFQFDAGSFKTQSADELIEMMKKGNPWKNIELVHSVFHDNSGSLFYEGTDSVSGERFRIAEFLVTRQRKVSSCMACIVKLTPGST